MLPEGYIQSRYWPGNYWNAQYFPNYSGWRKIALEGSDATFLNLTADTIQASNGFTGTGAYTNFTIVGGVITAAS